MHPYIDISSKKKRLGYIIAFLGAILIILAVLFFPIMIATIGSSEEWFTFPTLLSNMTNVEPVDNEFATSEQQSAGMAVWQFFFWSALIVPIVIAILALIQIIIPNKPLPADNRTLGTAVLITTFSGIGVLLFLLIAVILSLSVNLALDTVGESNNNSFGVSGGFGIWMMPLGSAIALAGGIIAIIQQPRPKQVLQYGGGGGAP